MFAAKSIPTDHKDLIHDVAFDFYGRRMATCSSDQVVRIWDMDENGEWVCSNILKNHNGSVWKVTWAHPEFGQIIATCSFDRTALVWEENVGDYSSGVQRTWYKRASLVDSRSSVTDVKFSPKSQGLQLAVCSSDGVVRIYESSDIMDLCIWSLRCEIATKLVSCSCLSWNPSPSRLHPPLIAVGSDDTNSTGGGKVAIFEYAESLGAWGKVETVTMVTDPVNDIAFAPNLGRAYHLLAVATKDVIILSLKAKSSTDPSQGTSSSFEVRLAGRFQEHGQSVWRVSWNMTGTLLASSGDDGCVRLWKANYLDEWKCISTLKGNEIIRSVNSNNENFWDKASAGQQTKYFKLASTSHPSHVPWH